MRISAAARRALSGFGIGSILGYTRLQAGAAMNYTGMIGTQTVCVISSAVLLAECPVDRIIVNGQVEHAPPNGTIKVQLIYPKDKIDDLGILAFQQSR
jgi:hypothetical protein